MSKLQILPAQLANMIAAGEVVQRPASVVKELLENAVDAGATDVKVVVLDAGRTLIQVIDNGSGMSAADAVLCFERHATSKIAAAEDLAAISSYGFRGEALASIAAVSEVTLRTRRAADETATQVVVGGGAGSGGQGSASNVRTSSVAAPVGSNFAVRNLFYNTPARRKFLKSDNVELKHIVEEFPRVALTRPDIGFSLRSNDRDLYVLKPAKSLKFRILDLMGSNVAQDVVDLSADTTTVKISGFLGRPQSARKTVANQYFFVNGRYFGSGYLRKAVLKGYEGFVAPDVQPSWFIWLDVAPGSVDVNISPTKSEVKFEDENVIFQILYACVKETLGRNAFGDGIDFDAASSVQMPVLGRNFEAIHGPVSAPGPEVDAEYDPFASAGQGGDGMPGWGGEPIPSEWGSEPWAGGARQSGEFGPGAGGGFSAGQGGYRPASRERADALFDKYPEAPKLLVLKGKYIISQAASGLMAVNIRRAAERVAYEKALKVLSRGGHVSQKALFPVPVQVGVQARLLFEEQARTLASLGFDISPFGNDTVVVNGVPEGLSCEPGKVEQMVQDMVLILSDSPAGGMQDTVAAVTAAKFATLESIGFSVSGPTDAQALLDSLFSCENAELTPSGRRIISIISIEELDKKF
ncbi:MAG: DNA mismatch repair endonuclease MutL [Bacteroidales bacterium]|nr:DNA mismatch repair endonuclease MutL [Bacteroidales bacterium]